jgi:hypothetical protein
MPGSFVPHVGFYRDIIEEAATLKEIQKWERPYKTGRYAKFGTSGCVYDWNTRPGLAKDGKICFRISMH